MKVNKTCDFLLGQGIFTALNEFNVPWKDKNIASLLDTEFYTTFGNRETSPLVDYLIGNKAQLSTEDTQKLASMIYNKFSDNWNRIDLAFSKEYNPIWNKDGTETTTTENSEKITTYEKGNQTNKTTKGEQINTNDYGDGQTTESQGATKTTNAYGEDRTTTANGERQTKDSGKTTTTENKTAAFNSSTYQDDPQSTETDGGNTVTEKAVTDTTTKAAKTDSVTTDAVTNTTKEKARTDVLTEGQREDTFTDGARTDTTNEGANTQTTTYTFGGNIGVTMTQEMLTAEFNMREKYNFFDIIFRNVDSIMSCGYYLQDC